ncbi:uncharacterized protein WM277_008786 isoform 2-T2 [Molossus nigricans]
MEKAFGGAESALLGVSHVGLLVEDVSRRETAKVEQDIAPCKLEEQQGRQCDRNRAREGHVEGEEAGWRGRAACGVTLESLPVARPALSQQPVLSRSSGPSEAGDGRSEACLELSGFPVSQRRLFVPSGSSR